jgi:hypothetical protein
MGRNLKTAAAILAVLFTATATVSAQENIIKEIGFHAARPSTRVQLS